MAHVVAMIHCFAFAHGTGLARIVDRHVNRDLAGVLEHQRQVDHIAILKRLSQPHQHDVMATAL